MILKLSDGRQVRVDDPELRRLPNTYEWIDWRDQRVVKFRRVHVRCEGGDSVQGWVEYHEVRE